MRHISRTFRSAFFPLAIFVLVWMSPSPSSAQMKTEDELRAKVEETPSAMVRPHVVRKLSVKGKIAVAVTLVVGGLTALAFSLRTWISSNLFGRQYRFPPVEFVALRLGGKKSGGHMGTI